MPRRRYADMSLVWATAALRVDLTVLTDGFRLRGVADVIRRAVDGQSNRIADAATAGYVLSLTLRDGDALQQLRANPSGVAGLRLADDQAYAIPMTLERIRRTAPQNNLAAVAVTLVQDLTDPDRVAVHGAPVTAGQLAVAAGETGWIFAAGGVTRHTAAAAVPAAPAWGVAGAALVAEGVSR